MVLKLNPKIWYSASLKLTNIVVSSNELFLRRLLPVFLVPLSGLVLWLHLPDIYGLFWLLLP